MTKDQLINPKSIHLSTPHLMSIPAKESEIQELEKHRKWLLEEGKREIVICCDNTLEFLQGAIHLGITERELQILITTLHLHPYDTFGRNKFEIGKGKSRSIDVESLIREVIEISSFLSNKLQAYFKKEFYDLVQKENTSSGWILTLEKFNKKWKEIVGAPNGQQNISSSPNQRIEELLEEMDKSSAIFIHKDLPQYYFPVLERMEADGLILRKNHKYVMLTKGYDTLERFRNGQTLNPKLTVKEKADLMAMVRRNEIEVVLERINGIILTGNEDTKQITLTQRRFTDLRNSMIKGTITKEDERLEKNRISESIVDIIQNLT